MPHFSQTLGRTCAFDPSGSNLAKLHGEFANNLPSFQLQYETAGGQDYLKRHSPVVVAYDYHRTARFQEDRKSVKKKQAEKEQEAKRPLLEPHFGCVERNPRACSFPKASREVGSPDRSRVQRGVASPCDLAAGFPLPEGASVSPQRPQLSHAPKGTLGDVLFPSSLASPAQESKTAANVRVPEQSTERFAASSSAAAKRATYDPWHVHVRGECRMDRASGRDGRSLASLRDAAHRRHQRVLSEGRDVVPSQAESGPGVASLPSHSSTRDRRGGGVDASVAFNVAGSEAPRDDRLASRKAVADDPRGRREERGEEDGAAQIEPQLSADATTTGVGAGGDRPARNGDIGKCAVSEKWTADRWQSRVALDRERDATHVRAHGFRSDAGRERAPICSPLPLANFDYKPIDPDRGRTFLERRMPAIRFPEDKRHVGNAIPHPIQDQAFDSPALVQRSDPNAAATLAMTNGSGISGVASAVTGASPPPSDVRDRGAAVTGGDLKSTAKWIEKDAALVSLDEQLRAAAKVGPHRAMQLRHRTQGRVPFDLDAFFRSAKFQRRLRAFDEELERVNAETIASAVQRQQREASVGSPTPGSTSNERHSTRADVPAAKSTADTVASVLPSLVPKSFLEEQEFRAFQEHVNALKGLSVTRDDMSNQWQGSLPPSKFKTLTWQTDMRMSNTERFDDLRLGAKSCSPTVAAMLRLDEFRETRDKELMRTRERAARGRQAENNNHGAGAGDVATGGGNQQPSRTVRRASLQPISLGDFTGKLASLL